MRKHAVSVANKGSVGFTLIELMVTLSVAAILIAIAVPSITTTIQNSRLTSPANDLLHSFQLGRTEAIKQRQNVAVCASNNPDDANASCSYGPFRGWIVFVDSNSDWQRQPAEDLIERHALVDDSLSVKTDNDGIVSYSPSGFRFSPVPAPKNATANITLCDSRGNQKTGSGASAQSTARALIIDATGRARVSKLYDDVAAAGGC